MPLAVTVEAGENFPDNEAVTLARLRKGAKPSVAITGTVSAVDMQDGGITGAKLADTTIPASKMGDAVTTGESGAGKKGVILASDATNKFNELYAGKRNAFLIGSSTKTGEAWTDEYLLKSKTLNTEESSLEVTDQTANDFTLKVKDGGIVKDMMATNSVGSSALSNYAVTINSIAPGGGSSSSGGIAKETNQFWGGIIDFDPNTESGTTGWHGKAGALPATGMNQTLYSTAIGARLTFGYHPCIPRAWATVFNNSNDGQSDSDTSAVGEFSRIGHSGIAAVERTALGIYKFHFESNIYATGDAPKAFGFGFRTGSDHSYYYQMIPYVSGTVITENDVQKIEIKFFGNIHASSLGSSTGAQNWRYCQIQFF
jgi:hypothetical protein